MSALDATLFSFAVLILAAVVVVQMVAFYRLRRRHRACRHRLSDVAHEREDLRHQLRSMTTRAEAAERQLTRLPQSRPQE